MALNREQVETLVVWNEAIELYDSQLYEDAIAKFESIPQKSSRILFSIGQCCIQAKYYVKGEQFLSQAVRQDPHLAIGYVLKGFTEFKLKKYVAAQRSLTLAFEKLRGQEFINYKQIGLPYKLHASDVIINLALYKLLACDSLSALDTINLAKENARVIKARDAIENGETFDPVLIPVTAVYKPDDALLKNISKKDYLGKSKVVAAVKEEEGNNDDEKLKIPKVNGSRSAPSSPTEKVKGFFSPSKQRSKEAPAQLNIDEDKYKWLKENIPTMPPPRPALHQKHLIGRAAVGSIDTEKNGLSHSYYKNDSSDVPNRSRDFKKQCTPPRPLPPRPSSPIVSRTPPQSTPPKPRRPPPRLVVNH